MESNEKLIELLNREGAVSGTEIGDVLGVSRAAVQKRIQQLVENGLPVSASAGKGYTLGEGVVLLSEKAIRSSLKTPLIESIDVLQSVNSTNSYLLNQSINSGSAKLCVSEAQIAGRGRRGNEWESAPYRNIMLSLSWGFDHWPETITGLGLAVSLVIAEHLNKSLLVDGSESVRIKWPNDLLVNQDKLGGILIDVAGESSGACNVVIGVGLNVHQPDWSTNDAYKWQDLNSLDVKVDRNALIASLADGLVDMLGDFAQSGFAPLTARWNSLSSYAGAKISVGNEGDLIEGLMHGVDSIGALLVMDDHDQIQRFTDSNVSVRLV
jgi:BirA family biotin operon repressor/biotin-[acetyl-CoA-carboxylase] ligase